MNLLLRALGRWPWLGLSIQFYVAAGALWFYTWKAYHDSGYVGLIFILPFALIGTAFAWVMTKFARLMDRWDRQDAAKVEAQQLAEDEEEDENDMESVCQDCGAWPEFQAARMAKKKYGVVLCAPCYTKRSNTPDTVTCTECGAPIHTADPIAETSIRFKGRLLCQMCYSNNGKAKAHIVSQGTNEQCERCARVADKLYADRAKGPYLCAECWRDPYSETPHDAYVMLARRLERGELSQEQYLVLLNALISGE